MTSDASGFTTGSGMIEARFVVRRSDTVAFDKIKRAMIEWGLEFHGSDSDSAGS